ncbi:hypothetical protein [Romboutsia ilealis]|nr:hypothetical protein [Romboutsia ilealis]
MKLKIGIEYFIDFKSKVKYLTKKDICLGLLASILSKLITVLN